MSAVATESGHCTNGDCTKPLYRGKECYRCWLGTKWDSMKARIENRNGNYHTYEGLPLGFTRQEFVAWGMLNQPQPSITSPSIDRVIPELGYVFENIRWLDTRRNSAGIQRDIPDGYKLCPKCCVVKPIQGHFKPAKRRWGQQVTTYCNECDTGVKANGNSI